MRLSTIRPVVRPLASLALSFNLIAPFAAAQSNGDNQKTSLRGYSITTSKAQTEWEAKFRAIPNPENLRANMKRLSAEPHHVGSAYDKQNAEYILEQFKSWGFDAQIEEFDVLFPTPKERVVELIEPTRFELC